MIEEPKRKFTGVFIPAAIWEAVNLSWLEKCLLAEIELLEDDERGCWASNAYLAKLFNSTPGSIANMIRKLKRFGHITIDPFDGFHRCIRMTTPMHSQVQGGAPTSAWGLHSQVQALIGEDKVEKKEKSKGVESKQNKANQDLPLAPETPISSPPLDAPPLPSSGKAGPTDTGLKEADAFRALLPDGFLLPKNWRAKWAKEFDALADDGRDEELTAEVCRWARSDAFWSSHIMSPSSLRERDRHGVMRYDSPFGRDEVCVAPEAQF